MKYTKRISLLLALVMVFCVMVFVVNAEETDHTNCECQGAAKVAEHTYREVTGEWTELGTVGATEPVSVDRETLAAGGNFKLVSDVVVSGQISVAKNAAVHLDLNGFTLSRAGRVFSCWNGSGTVTVTDSSSDQTGKIKSTGNTSEGGCIAIAAGSKFRLYAGTLDASEVTLNSTLSQPGGAAVYMNASGDVMEMFGGAILGGKTATAGSGINGGAIAIKNGTVTVYAGTISGGAAGNTGGVIYNQGNFTVKGGQIEGGSAGTNGGTIYNGGTFTMEGGSIVGGTATKAGGAIRNDGTFTITDGSITGGIAANGGAVNNGGGGTFTVNGGTVTGGTANATMNEDGSYSADGLGGVFYITSGTVSISKGSVSGGTAYRGATVYVAAGTCNLSDQGQIIGGTATNAGGAVMNRDTFVMTGGTITGGQGGNVGGAVRNDKSFTMTGGSIVGGTANYEGGTIYNTSVFTMEAGSITAADAEKCANYGGAVMNHTSGTFAVSGGTVTGGTVKENGGAIYNRAALNISGGEIKGGIAKNGGVIFNDANDAAVITVSGGKITGGTALTTLDENGGYASDGQGASVYVAGGSVTVSDGTVTGGQAYRGGAIMNEAQLTISGGTITGGSVTATGGTIYSSGTVTMTGGNIVGGTANNGAAVHNAGTFHLMDGTIAGGEAKNNSGTIRNGGSFVMDGGDIIGGTAKNGGVMYTDKPFTMNGGTIIGGEASANGGAIYVAADTFTMNGGTITGGAASKGGAVYAEGSVVMTGGTINGGQARNGGAIYIKNATLKIAGDTQSEYLPSLISGTSNSDAFYGAVIYAAGATVQISDAYMEANTYANRGTAMCADAACTISMENVTVSGTYKTATAIWTESPVTLAGYINMPYEGVDILLDNRSATGVILYAENLNTTDILQIRRMAQAGIVQETPGFVGTMTEEQASLFKAYKSGYCTDYVDGGLYIVQAAAGMVWATEEGRQEAYYLAFEEAWAAYEEGMLFVICSNLDGITFDRDVLVDLNGFALTNVTVNAGVTVTGLDSATDDYDCEDGYGSISGNILGTVKKLSQTDAQSWTDYEGVKRQYVAIYGEDGSVSFHRYDLKITHMSINPSAVGVGYKAVFAGDSVVRQHVTAIGYNMQLGNYNKITRQKDGTAFAAAEQSLTLLVKNYNVANYGETALYANVFMIIDGETVESTVEGHSLRNMIEAADANYNNYTPEQIEALKGMVASYADIMKNWELPNLTNA